MPNNDITKYSGNTRFTSENQPPNRGRKTGSRTRSTIVKQWLEVESEITNPFTGKKELLEQQDIITLMLIKLAREGDVSAYKELMDSAYGKVLQSMEDKIADQELVAPPLIVYNTAPPMMTEEPPEDFDTTTNV